MSILDRLGGRKMAICLGAVVICLVAVLIKGDVPEGLRDMLKYLTGLLVGGNIAADAVDAFRAKAEEPTQVVVTEQPAAPAVQGAEEIHILGARLNQAEQNISQLAGMSQQLQNTVNYLVTSYTKT